MNKTALITGASSDIGQHIARILAQSGFNIAAHYYKNLSRVQQLEDMSEKCGIKFHAFKCDLKQIENSKAMVEDVISKFNRIDVLINTIGPFYYRDILEVTPEQWVEAINMNLNIAFNVTHYAMPFIVKAKGHIINFTFSGVENLKSWPMSADYCAAKTGIAVLTKALAAKLASHGVRVNAISPGMMESEASTKEELFDTAKRLSMPIPAGRLGKPAEIAEVVNWLVTSSPAYVTGALMPVSGAWEY